MTARYQSTTLGWLSATTLSWCLSCFLAPAALAADDLDRVMSALAERKHGEVTFVERKYLAVLDRPVESSGELLYDAPDRLEKRTLKPKPETLVLEHGVVTAERGRHRYQLDLQRYPQVLPFIESIRATLAGDRAALERVFHVNFSGDFQHWTLDLEPGASQLAGLVKHIRIQGEQAMVRTVEIQEADGDRSEMIIGDEAHP